MTDRKKPGGLPGIARHAGRWYARRTPRLRWGILVALILLPFAIGLTLTAGSNTSAPTTLNGAAETTTTSEYALSPAEADFISDARQSGFYAEVERVLGPEMDSLGIRTEGQVLSYAQSIAVYRDIDGFSKEETVESLRDDLALDGLSTGFASSLTDAAWETMYLP